MKMLGWIAVALSVVVPLRAQSCKTMLYEHRNQIDPPTIELRQVEGKVTDSTGIAIPRVCIGIFTEAEHKLVRYTESDANGFFQLDTEGLPDADYRLVGQYDGFCPANAKIRRKSKSHRKKVLAIHMKVAAIDTCSYVEMEKKKVSEGFFPQSGPGLSDHR